MSDATNGDRAFFRDGGVAAWLTILLPPLLFGATLLLASNVADVRYERDVTRMAFNDNLELLERVKMEVAASHDTLAAVRTRLAGSDPGSDSDSGSGKPYLVVSIADHRLWYKRGPEVLFSTRVATGTGKNLERAGGQRWKFETPRGRLVVERKDVEPAWIPPDWHYVEVARRRGLRVAKLERGKVLTGDGGATITVQGSDVVAQYPDGRVVPFEVREGKEIQAGRAIVIPPFGTNQRKYFGTLGSNRLYLGDGYGIHGTDEPGSIGRDASHGCVRVRNEDAELLFRIVPIGTPVYIY